MSTFQTKGLPQIPLSGENYEVVFQGETEFKENVIFSGTTNAIALSNVASPASNVEDQVEGQLCYDTGYDCPNYRDASAWYVARGHSVSNISVTLTADEPKFGGTGATNSSTTNMTEGVVIMNLASGCDVVIQYDTGDADVHGAPTSYTDDYKELMFVSIDNTAANTLVVHDLAGVAGNDRTFTIPDSAGNGEEGDFILLRAFQGYWYCAGVSPNVTLT